MYIAIDNSHLTDIANAIRSKNGSADTYKPREMAEAIAAIPTGGSGGTAQKIEMVGYVIIPVVEPPLIALENRYSSQKIESVNIEIE